MLIEETKTECLLGMLLCLDREQRIIFIFGGIFGMGGITGSEILEISEENYRKKLSRARKDLKNYLDNNCGLINGNNACRCSKKARAAMEAGYINPDNLQFTDHHLRNVNDYIEKVRIEADDFFIYQKNNKIIITYHYEKYRSVILRMIRQQGGVEG